MKTARVDHVIIGAGIAGTWLARRLLSIGRRVALVEIGPPDQDGTSPPRPKVHFPERENVGATQARHQVLSGNSGYWGGGLIRNDSPSLRAMFDLDEGAEALAEFGRAYEIVERELNTPGTRRTALSGRMALGRVSEVTVLPGRKRNIARSALASCARRDGWTLLCPAEVVDVDLGQDGAVRAMEVRSADGTQVVLVADHFVLAMGVIDTNIFALTWLSSILKPRRPGIATCLHDHWSVPIATVRWKRDAGLEWLYPPTFRRGFVQGTRFEMDADLPGGLRSGFLHLQADYDLVEPYATIKKWMTARQQGRGWTEQARYLPPLMRHGWRLGRIGYGRYVDRRLYVFDGMPLNVVLDFESHPSEDNRLTAENGEHRLYWDIREQDVATFAALLKRGMPLLQEWVRDCGLDGEVLINSDRNETLREYLAARATDAYHLGGGLAVGRDPDRDILGRDLSFHGIRNVAVLSTAAFRRPGIANPVETLLAMAERYASSVSKSSSDA